MKITLVTNAKTEQDYLDLCQGHQNNYLSEDGRRHCLKLKDKLKDKHFDYCYMSPLIRCVETAIILIGDRVQTFSDKKIIERDIGEFVGMPKKFYDEKKYWDYSSNCTDRGVEAIQDVFHRCEDFLHYIMEKYKEEHILVVSSPDIVRILRHLILKQNSKGDLLDKEIDNLYYEEFEIK